MPKSKYDYLQNVEPTKVVKFRVWLAMKICPWWSIQYTSKCCRCDREGVVAILGQVFCGEHDRAIRAERLKSGRVGVVQPLEGVLPDDAGGDINLPSCRV